MGGANALALLASLGGYIAYSKLLAPAEFALYAAALSIAKLGGSLLDGGLKLSLIRRDHDPRDYASALLASKWLALAGIAVLVAALAVLVSIQSITSSAAGFLFAYAAAYYAPYPWLVGPLARLEKGGAFSTVARAEASGTAIEYALPAVLWLAVAPGFWSFALSVWIGRLVRLIWIRRCDVAMEAVATTFEHTFRLLKEGLRFQLAALVSAVRDNLHFIVVAPWFGQTQAGIYAWLLQLCAAASQIFVQTASRVSLPWLLLATSDDEKWESTLLQIRLLSILCMPVLVLLVPVAPAVNLALFHGKWNDAMDLLPFLLLRMAPGLATTPLGALQFARFGAGAYLKSNIWWALGEALAAVSLCAFLGAPGLACSYSFMAWLGVALLIPGAKTLTKWRSLLNAMLLRPSLLISLGAILYFHALDEQSRSFISVMTLSAILYILALLSEELVRRELGKLLYRFRPNSKP